MRKRSESLLEASVSRRGALCGMAVLTLGLLGGDDAKDPRSTDPDVETILEQAKKAGLKKFTISRSLHYLGIGDAPPAFRQTGLKLCESLATTFQKHFKERGFDLKLPEERMTVVILSGPKAYAAFCDEPIGESEGGRYDIEANRLVMFDFQQDAARKGANVARMNTFSLVHEAMHQLTFATGLLSRQSDIPVAISEGLATYGELWQNRDQKIGQVNSLRLKAMGSDLAANWIPLEKLLTDDGLFTDPKTEQVAYAEAWLLVHTLIEARTGDWKGKLRDYLTLIHDRKDGSKRLGDAEEAFGHLDVLDRELKKRAARGA